MNVSGLRRCFGLFGLVILIAPLAVATIPVSVDSDDNSEPQGWWTETTVDKNQNKIGDMVELHMDNPIFLDEDNTLPLIIDFYYTPDQDEIEISAPVCRRWPAWGAEGTPKERL